MTEIEINGLRALCDLATPGPWFVREEPDAEGMAIIEDGRTNGLCPIHTEQHDAPFIVAARAALPALLDEIERLTLERDRFDGAAQVNALAAEQAREEAERLREAGAALTDAISTLAERAARCGWVDTDKSVKDQLDKAAAALVVKGAK